MFNYTKVGTYVSLVNNSSIRKCYKCYPLTVYDKLERFAILFNKNVILLFRIVSVPVTIFHSNPRLKHVNMSGNFLITLEIQVQFS